MKVARISILPVSVFGFMAMAALGWTLDGRRAASEAGTQKSLPATRASRGPGGSARHLPADVEKRLAPFRAARDEKERMRAAIDLASTIPASEIGTWLDEAWFSHRRGAAGTLFDKILMARWREEDPDAFFGWALKHRGGDAYNFVLAVAGDDPQRALSYFKTHPHQGLELNILRKLSDAHPELVLRRLTEIGGDVSATGYDYLTDDILGQLARRSPEALEAALESLPVTMRAEAETRLTEERMSKDFASELRKLMDDPDGLVRFHEIFNRNATLRDNLPAELADLPAAWKEQVSRYCENFVQGKDPGAWLRTDLVAAGFSPQQAADIRLAALGPLFLAKPEDALQHLAAMDASRGVRDNLLQNAFFELRGNPEKSAALLALLETDEDRETASRALKIQSDRARAEIKDPAEWLEQVSTYDIGKEWPYAHLEMLERWRPEQIAVIAGKFGSMPDDAKAPLARVLALANDIDSGLKGDAVRYLVSNPGDGTALFNPDPFAEQESADPEVRSINLASSYIAGLSESDPAAAGKWLASLPEGDARWWASKNLHSIWSGYDPEAADRWLGSLPETEQKQIRQIRKK